VAITIALVRFRVPLDYRLGGKLRIDLALMLIELPFSIIGVVMYAYRLANSGHGSRGQGEKNTVVAGFSFVISLAWVFCAACGTFVLPVMVWKNYYRRRRAVIKSESLSFQQTN
jgi:hypothetical protein